MLDRELIRRLTLRLLRPVLRFCVRHAQRIQDIVDLVKFCLLQIAAEELLSRHERVTASRLSVMTGMHRRDVAKYGSPRAIETGSRDLTIKVMGKWQSSPQLTTKAHTPRVLSARGEQSEFSTLVKSVSRDLNPATVLFELQRLGIVEVSDNSAHLVRDSYTPKGDCEAGFAILESDLSEVIAAAEENVLAAPQIPNLHCRTAYDRIRPSALPDIRRWLLREGHAFHARAREYISQFDQDINPDPSFSGRGARVVVGSFGKTDEGER